MKMFSDYVSKARAEPRETDNVVKGRFEIKKSDDEQHLAFGWASVAVRRDGKQIKDWDDDKIDIEDLEQAVYKYVELYRDGGELHERGGVAVLVESMVFTKEKLNALGLSDDALPKGWWIGMRVLDSDVWEKVKDGTYSMFSIEGSAARKKEEDE